MINSILDQDLYSFTVGQAILAHYPNIHVEYRFSNRNPQGDLEDGFLKRLRDKVDAMKDLSISEDEADYLKSIPFMTPQYIEWIRRYRFDPSQVKMKLVDGDLALDIEGPWESTIYWEVPLMALISETYFEKKPLSSYDWSEQTRRATEKGRRLAGLRFTDFGTRRRRSFEVQDLVVSILKDYEGFQGTSNVYLAMKHGIKPIGTMSHQWIMGVSAMEGLIRANWHAMKKWDEVYKGRLGIALTDTFGTEVFWRDFDAQLARLYDGVRHDSSSPYDFADRAIDHYKALGIYPPSKTVVFSDGLNTDSCVKLGAAYKDKISTSFGIGTHFSNDIPGSPALRIVIKLYKCNGRHVVKFGDGSGKGTGDKDAQRVARYVFFGTSLDAQP